MPADSVAMLRILNAAADAHTSSLDDRQWTEGQLTELIRHASSDYASFVAERGGEILGWSAIVPHHEREAYRPSVELLVFVHPACERRGIGTALASQALQHARDRGFHLVLAFTLDARGPAGRLARRLGFEHAGALHAALSVPGGWADLHVHFLRLADAVPGEVP